MFINSFLLCYTIREVEPLGVRQGGKIWEDQKVEPTKSGVKKTN